MKRAFDSFVLKTDTCWLWAGVRVGAYGNYYGTPAHRAAYERAYGPLEPESILHHVCRVKHCVRPEHLALTDKQEHGLIHGGDERHAFVMPLLTDSARDLLPITSMDLADHLDSIQRDYMLAALHQSQGIRTRAAKLLGMDYRSWRHYAATHGI
ncbi:MAG TPA: HNH endonuclease [Bryobacteraceae bacterium]|nr:HNH endonuclease [Bryobacteraceae bacterium]